MTTEKTLLLKELNELKAELETSCGKTMPLADFIKWVNKSINLFIKAGVDEFLIEKFFAYCETSKANMENPQGDQFFGWQSDGNASIAAIRIGPDPTKCYIYQIIFQAAETKIQMYTDERKLIPLSLINSLEGFKLGGDSIRDSLLKMEDAYANKDPEKLIEKSRTCLDQVVNLHKSWNKKNGKEIRDLTPRLDHLKSDEGLMKSFGTNHQVLDALLVSVMVRNTIAHPKPGVTPPVTLPLPVAVMAAYLVVIFAASAINSGNFSIEL